MRTLPLDVLAAAKAAYNQTGVLPSVQLAQWCLESAWGSRPTGKFNYFGVKAASDQPATLCWTHEVVNGKTVSVQASFRDYDSLQSAFLAHARLLCSPRYAAGAPVKDNLPAFVHAIAPVYATDPDYAAKILDLIRIERFTQYDAPNPGADLTRKALEA